MVIHDDFLIYFNSAVTGTVNPIVELSFPGLTLFFLCLFILILIIR